MPETATSNSRASIFASIRQSLAASRPFDAQHQIHHRHSIAPGETITAPALPVNELIENFRSSLAFVGADCHIVRTAGEAAAVVRRIAEKHSANRIAISDSPLAEQAASALANAEIVRNAPAAELFNCDLGITTAQWGIAETGTLVLESDREASRITSLVPPVHICILRASALRQTLGEVLELLGRDLSRAITFITGASRTSDIELTLAIGVHGPRELHAILLSDK